MFRNVEVLLTGNPRLEDLVRQWEEILQRTDDPEARRQRDELTA
jgi:hypothetical protein